MDTQTKLQLNRIENHLLWLQSAMDELLRRLPEQKESCKGHEGEHWAPSGETWTEEEAEKVRQAHLDAACPVCPGCGAEYAPGDGGCFNCGDPVD